MKNYLAMYIGTTEAFETSEWSKLSDAQRREREAEGIKAWMQWGEKHASSIVEQGAPLGKTKRTSAQGISDIKNAMTGYVVVRADSHEAAAKLFERHPHFTIFPGESVEIMECLPLPPQ
jgi:hypothetical protein